MKLSSLQTHSNRSVCLFQFQWRCFQFVFLFRFLKFIFIISVFPNNNNNWTHNIVNNNLMLRTCLRLIISKRHRIEIRNFFSSIQHFPFLMVTFNNMCAITTWHIYIKRGYTLRYAKYFGLRNFLYNFRTHKTRHSRFASIKYQCYFVEIDV